MYYLLRSHLFFRIFPISNNIETNTNMALKTFSHRKWFNCDKGGHKNVIIQFHMPLLFVLRIAVCNDKSIECKTIFFFTCKSTIFGAKQHYRWHKHYAYREAMKIIELCIVYRLFDIIHIIIMTKKTNLYSLLKKKLSIQLWSYLNSNLDFWEFIPYIH